MYRNVLNFKNVSPVKSNNKSENFLSDGFKLFKSAPKRN